MRKSLLSLGVATALSLVAASANAQVWAEMNSGGLNGATDAGGTLPTANITDGMGALTTITGMLVTTGDADLYRIRITDVAAFTATVPGGPAGDTNLSLFDASGVALAFNNNNPDGGTGSRLTSLFVPAAGDYYLAISRNDSFGGFFGIPFDDIFVPIFPDAPNNVEVGPSVAGTGLNDWPASGGFQLFNFNYTITLTGAEYAIPSPAAAGLFGVAGLVALRRRR